jgi:hypothetical protein
VQAHVAGDGPPLLVVTGEPGVGKTRLLHEAYAMARVHGLSVLAGTVPAAGEAAGNPVLDALRRAIQQQAARLRCIPGKGARDYTELTHEVAMRPPRDRFGCSTSRMLTLSSVDSRAVPEASAVRACNARGCLSTMGEHLA